MGRLIANFFLARGSSYGDFQSTSHIFRFRPWGLDIAAQLWRPYIIVTDWLVSTFKRTRTFIGWSRNTQKMRSKINDGKELFAFFCGSTKKGTQDMRMNCSSTQLLRRKCALLLFYAIMSRGNFGNWSQKVRHEAKACGTSFLCEAEECQK